MTIVDFATFCYSGDFHRLHYSGQLKKQVLSNDYSFNQVIVVYQQCEPAKTLESPYPIRSIVIDNIDKILELYGIDLDKPQYISPTDKHHSWRFHVVNHLAAITYSNADYIVFADNDCWIVSQPNSWVNLGIEILSQNPDVFIVSPNDGEPERKTQVISQQMFMVRTEEFRNMDFNQPGYSGNPRDYPEIPEYHGMLEGRIHHYCKANNKYRYVLPSEYRYWHHNRINSETNHFETDLSKY